MAGPVLPYVPGFGERLAPYITQSGDTLANALLQRALMAKESRQEAKDRQLLQGLANSGDVTGTQLNAFWDQLSDKGRERYEPQFASELRKQEAAHKEGLKRETQALEKAERAESILESAKEMKDLLKYTGSTAVPFTSSFNAIPGGLNREGLQQRNKFDVLAADAASFFRDLETKGQLPQGLYEKVIEPRLPASKLSERENLGRIEGLEALAKKYGGKAFQSRNVESSLKKVEKGTKITEDVAKKILSQAKGNKEEARKIAKGLGYDL